MYLLIGEAVFGKLRWCGEIKYLLGEKGSEVHVQHRNTRGENALYLVLGLCNAAMFRVLVPRFQGGMR